MSVSLSLSKATSVSLSLSKSMSVFMQAQVHMNVHVQEKESRTHSGMPLRKIRSHGEGHMILHRGGGGGGTRHDSILQGGRGNIRRLEPSRVIAEDRFQI